MHKKALSLAFIDIIAPVDYEEYKRENARIDRIIEELTQAGDWEGGATDAKDTIRTNSTVARVGRDTQVKKAPIYGRNG